jgi:hypothetical protein
MRNNLCSFLCAALLTFVSAAQAQTVAWWRFEDGTAAANVIHSAGDGAFSPDIQDVSGNGNHLSVWATGGGAGYGYRSDTAFAVVPQTYDTNRLSVKNTGGVPGMFTQTGSNISTISPAAFTIEATFKLENGGYRTIVGRDSRGSVTANGDLAALYLQGVPENGLAIKFCDVSGYWHVAESAKNAYTGFTYGTNPDGIGTPWYSIAAVSDGAVLSLYLLEHGTDAAYRLIAQTDMTASGSPDTALTSGTGDGGDWDAGNWTVGRGLYAGNHGDRAYGFIDEVRISDSALQPSQFIASENFDSTAAYWRFEEGPADAQVARGGLAEGEFFPGVPDVTGKGNHLSAWSQTLGAHVYRVNVADSTVPLTRAANQFSLQNADDFPGLFTSSADASPAFDLEAWQPSVFTIEVSFQPLAGGHRTIVGRDGEHVAAINGQLAALYFQLQPDDSIAIKFADVSGYWHEAASAPGVIGYETARWYHAAAVCDGTTLKLYLNDVRAKLGYQLAAQTDMTVSGSPDRRLVAGVSDGSNWHGGGWSVGRGLYGGAHADRFKGHIDEVRISMTALEPNALLFYQEFYPGIAVTPSELVVHEQDTTSGDLLFSLDSPPAADVVLTLAEQDGREQISLSRSSLLFTTADWNVPQAVRVTAIDDSVLENAEHSVRISIGVSSPGDPAYDGLQANPAMVKVVDNECGAWGYAVTDLTLDCVTDLQDLAVFAADWLACSEPDEAGCLNFN